MRYRLWNTYSVSILVHDARNETYMYNIYHRREVRIRKSKSNSVSAHTIHRPQRHLDVPGIVAPFPVSPRSILHLVVTIRLLDSLRLCHKHGHPPPRALTEDIRTLHLRAWSVRVQMTRRVSLSGSHIRFSYSYSSHRQTDVETNSHRHM